MPSTCERYTQFYLCQTNGFRTDKLSIFFVLSVLTSDLLIPFALQKQALNIVKFLMYEGLVRVKENNFEYKYFQK